MNPHYHPYSELSSPHPPSPDNNNYGSIAGVHHNGHGPPTMNPIEGQQQGFHSINNNTPYKSCAGCGGNYLYCSCVFFIYFSVFLRIIKLKFTYFFFFKSHLQIKTI